MAVFECPECKLCQSISLAPFHEEFARTLSCDADWGNVRHGKGARFEGVMAWLEKIDFSQIDRVLDVGANRGHFVLWLEGCTSGTEIVAVEPDASVMAAYAGRPRIQSINERYENTDTGLHDFIYSVHSLEHAPSAREMLRHNLEQLTPRGRMLLEVPNIAAISDRDNVEEFFIDKHTFHFSRAVLCNMVRSLGFEVLAGEEETDPFNITLLLAPAGKQGQGSPARPATSQTARIAAYQSTLEQNRKALKKLVNEKLAPLSERQKVGYWGAGRIFNALVRYGGLLPEHVHTLVDRHLWQIIDHNDGIPISRPESLKQSEPQVLIILGRSSARNMRKQAEAMGIRHVILFQDLLAQVQ